MYIRKITDKIDYIGVNDRTTNLFEGLWPLPYGVSYNSFLVKGSEKTALIDTVEVSRAKEFVNCLKSDSVEKIDYLVVNHMEPDHSGGIPILIEAFPEIRIIGNKKTVEMIKGFYHLNDDKLFLEIRDGDVLSLGDISLKFMLTPMVHWPETMMTYCESEKALFSGDAFGSFGALNGGVTDYEMECGRYIVEMYRYYSNIVGKYGKFVLNALQKTLPLEIEFICSTHGPVWHDRIAEVIDITRRLASYQGEDGVTIIFGSMYGNTAEIAELFAIELNKLGIRNIHIHNACKASLSDMISDAFRYKGLIIGSPTYNTEIFPPVAQVVNALTSRDIKNKVVASFGGYSWASAAARKIEEALSADTLLDAGSVAMKQSMNPETEIAVKEIAENFVELLGKI